MTQRTFNEIRSKLSTLTIVAVCSLICCVASAAFLLAWELRYHEYRSAMKKANEQFSRELRLVD